MNFLPRLSARGAFLVAVQLTTSANNDLLLHTHSQLFVLTLVFRPSSALNITPPNPASQTRRSLETNLNASCRYLYRSFLTDDAEILEPAMIRKTHSYHHQPKHPQALLSQHRSYSSRCSPYPATSAAGSDTPTAATAVAHSRA